MNRRTFLKAAPILPLTAMLAINPLTGDTEMKVGMWLVTVDQDLGWTPRHYQEMHKALSATETPKSLIVPEGVTIEWVGKG